MNAPARQTIANQLFDRLQPYLDSGAAPSQFDLRSISREAQKLAAVAPAEAAHVRAVLACIQWDHAEVDTQVAEFLRHDSSLDAQMAMSHVYTFINNFERAVEIARQAWKSAPANRQARHLLVTLLLQSGRMGEALAFVAALGETMAAYVDHSPQQTERLVKVMEELDVSAERVARDIKVGFELLAEKHIRMRRTDVARFRDAEDGALSLMAMLHFQGDVYDEIELAEALAARLVVFADWDPVIFSVKFEHTLPQSNGQLAA